MAKYGYESFDFAARRKDVFEKVKQAFSSWPAFIGQTYTMTLEDVDYDDDDFSSDPKKEKEALIHYGTYGKRLLGTWKLKDTSTGRVIAQSRVPLAKIPVLTDRGVFIVNGNAWSVANQLRLRPGIYVRFDHAGFPFAHINVANGAHRYWFDPERSLFFMETGYGNVPLITVLKYLGISDKDIASAWGKDIYEKNIRIDNELALDRLVRSWHLKDRQEIARIIRQFELDPSVIERNFGITSSHLTPELMLLTSKKLLDLNYGKIDPDDRDSLFYQRFVPASTIFNTNIKLASEGARKLFWKAVSTRQLSHIKPYMFQRIVEDVIQNTGLGTVLSEINPLEILDNNNRIIRTGKGGIENIHAIPETSRNVQPSFLGFIDPIVTPESAKIGTDIRLGIGAYVGERGRLLAPFKTRTGEVVWKTVHGLADSIVSFPTELDSKRKYVFGVYKGQIGIFPRNKVDYEPLNYNYNFSIAANLIPLKSTIYPQRAAMGSRMLTQALQLESKQAPYVQSAMPETNGEKSWEDYVGQNILSVSSPIAGVVTDVKPDRIKIKSADGKVISVNLYNHLPYNRKTFFTHLPKVSVGEKVKPGQIIAISNWTDDNGTLSLGTNALVAYIPYKGLNYEDAIVISRSFANRTKSKHLYRIIADPEIIKMSKKSFISLFPGQYTLQQLEKYDDDGVVKPGTVINEKDPVVLAVKELPSKSRSRRLYTDASIVWDKSSPGVVVETYKSPTKVNVLVATDHTTEVGDKFSDRFGNKGVVSEIVEDNLMPKTKDGRTVDVILNPLGINRGNAGQLIEAILGKIAEKTGKVYKIDDFSPEILQTGFIKFVKQEMAKSGVPETEVLIDPETGRPIKNVFIGNKYLLKLHHVASSKLGARDIGSYTAEEVPVKGGEEGAKRIGIMELNALLAHGAYNFIKDAKLIRGQKNEDFWRQFMQGYDPYIPDEPLTYKKFLNQLQAIGINPVKKGIKLQLLALTNSDIKALTGPRLLKNSETVNWRINNMIPIDGGLFDEKLTGGHEGKLWSAIQLTEPMPSPVMEDAIIKLLKLSEKDFLEILAGNKELPYTKAKRGPEAIREALASLKIDKEIEQEKYNAEHKTGLYRDKAIRRLLILNAIKQNNLKPEDWIWERVPVLPPLFRPIVLVGSKVPVTSDSNYLYQEIWDANQNLKELKGKADVSEERKTLYKAIKGLIGLTDPIRTQNISKNVKGILRQIFGDSPKYGMVQRKLLGMSLDVVGRGTIVPDPTLDLDEVGLPEEQAWVIYRPFIIRRLVSEGASFDAAIDHWKNKTDVAKKAMLREFEVRPVIINRAPTLHKFNIMAFWPVLKSGRVIHVHPAVTKGFGADFDGDTMQFHVPISAAAVKEASEKMLPSKNLLSVAEFKAHYIPSMEFLQGLWVATQPASKKEVRFFRTKDDAISAYKRGEIAINDPIRILSTI